MSSVGFLRPRMGIGGSERLIADAAVALKQRGHQVTLFVPDRMDVAQFPELADNRIAFSHAGAFLPSEVLGRLRAPMAIARTALAGWHMTRHSSPPDVIFSDVVPHVIPFVKRLSSAPVLYFCHFPDLLLTRDGSRQSASYRTYRRPLDMVEEQGVAAADLVVTNSHFTAGIVRETFPSVDKSRMRVLYPGVATNALEEWPDGGELCILSVSRFDPRKNLALAVEALGALRTRVAADVFSRVRLVLAGYYDQRLPEAVALVENLRRIAAQAQLSDHVRLVFSPSEEERRALLAQSWCVIYTPTAEHFGYVPIEAMTAGRPVVAVNNGGPAETVVDGVTGFLCPPTGEAFADALARLLCDRDAAASLGRTGHDHVRDRFSLDAFGNGLDALIGELTNRRPDAAVTGAR
jgi:alpha-1,3/alpha-1,6-mannosyltransferase